MGFLNFHRDDQPSQQGFLTVILVAAVWKRIGYICIECIDYMHTRIKRSYIYIYMWYICDIFVCFHSTSIWILYENYATAYLWAKVPLSALPRSRSCNLLEMGGPCEQCSLSRGWCAMTSECGTDDGSPWRKTEPLKVCSHPTFKMATFSRWEFLGFLMKDLGSYP